MNPKAKFLHGSLWRHIIVMTLSASVGMLSLFIVEFVDLFFIAQLGDNSLTAAIGFSSTITFFIVSVSIGMLIAAVALASQKIGAQQEEDAKRLASNTLYIGFAITSVLTLAIWLLAPQILSLLGAKGETLSHAIMYMRIIVPSMPVLTIAFVGSGILRAHGDAKRAMYTTMTAGIINAILDPILIFGLDMGLAGAAIASVCGYIGMAYIAMRPVFKYYGGISRFHWPSIKLDMPAIFGISLPAILTNIATPVGNIMVIRALAFYGDSVMAGYAVIGRMTPLALCLIYALSGAVGPIIGQNFGAKAFDRIRDTITRATIFCAGYIVLVWGLMISLLPWITDVFKLETGGKALLETFVIFAVPLAFFNGVIFVGNATFNTMGRPIWSSFVNWGRNTLGILPFIAVGALWYGANGVIIGQALGAIVFAGLAFYLSLKLVDGYQTGRMTLDKKEKAQVKAMSEPNEPPMGTV